MLRTPALDSLTAYARSHRGEVGFTFTGEAHEQFGIRISYTDPHEETPVVKEMGFTSSTDRMRSIEHLFGEVMAELAHRRRCRQGPAEDVRYPA